MVEVYFSHIRLFVFKKTLEIFLHWNSLKNYCLSAFKVSCVSIVSYTVLAPGDTGLKRLKYIGKMFNPTVYAKYLNSSKPIVKRSVNLVSVHIAIFRTWGYIANTGYWLKRAPGERSLTFCPERRSNRTSSRFLST